MPPKKGRGSKNLGKTELSNEPKRSKKASDSESEEMDFSELPESETKLKDAVKVMNDTIQKNEKIDPNEAFKAIFLLLSKMDYEKRISELETKVNGLEKELEEQNDYVEELESRILIQEVAAHDKKIVLRNLALHTDADKGKENWGQTRQLVNEICEKVELSTEIIRDCQRIYVKTKPNAKTNANAKQKFPSIFIEFYSRENMATFMQKLPTIKKIQYLENIVVDRYVPPTLIKEHDVAAKEAYSCRKKGMKTKILISREGKIILLVKDENDKDFKKRDY